MSEKWVIGSITPWTLKRIVYFNIIFTMSLAVDRQDEDSRHDLEGQGPC